jgi:hypothetical protein
MTPNFIRCLIVSSLLISVITQEVVVSVEGGEFECVGEGCFGGSTSTLKVVNRDKEVIPPKHYRDLFKLGEVRRVDWKDPKEPFAQRVIARNKPVVLQSGTQVHRDWKALGKWNRDYLLKKLGPKSVMGGIYHSTIPTIYLYRDGADSKTYDQTYGQRPYEVVELTVKQLFEKSLKPDTYGYYYYSQSVKHLGPAAQDLLTDLRPTNILSPDPTKDLPQKVQFWYGSKGVTTQMHYDLSYNFFVQITGTKTFLLLPPENHKNIYMFPRVHPHHRRSQANLTAIDLEVFPKFAEVTGALEVTLKAGDMLYLPPLWFHHVINNDAGFSVNVWTDYTLQELYQGLFKKLLTINKEFNVGVKLHTLQYLVSELLERTGFEPTDFMQVLYKQRYQSILEEPLSGDPSNPDMYCQVDVELNIDKENFEAYLSQVVDHVKKIEGTAREIILADYIDILSWRVLGKENVPMLFNYCFQ